jgi:tetratricopeptide (TPR) repeat protein
MSALRPLVVLLALAGGARAEDDPDTEIARRHFQAGARAYEAHDYRAALAEFALARRVNAAPALDYNIGRCHDRLEEAGPAVEAYRRYLAAQPDAADAAEVRARVAVLERRLAPASSPPPALPPRRSPLAPALVGALAVGLAGAGAGLLGFAAADFGHLHDTCAPSCAPSSWSALPAYEHAGEALLAAAAVAVAVDVALWVLRARASRERRVAWSGAW